MRLTMEPIDSVNRRTIQSNFKMQQIDCTPLVAHTLRTKRLKEQTFK